MGDVWPVSNPSVECNSANFSDMSISEKSHMPLYRLSNSSHSSSDAFFDSYHFNQEDAFMDSTSMFSGANSCKRRVRRRNRRRRSGRLGCRISNLGQLSKNEEDFDSDDYVGADDSGWSNDNQSSFSLGNMLLNVPSSSKLNNSAYQDSEDNTNKSLNYKLTAVNSTQNNQIPLKSIIIDGANVALCHGNNDCYSYEGIQLCIDWFKSRGHSKIKVVLPSWHVDPKGYLLYSYRGKEVLTQPQVQKYLLHTNSSPNDRQFICNYIINLAVKSNSIIVTNDRYGDITKNNSEMKKQVYERLLSYIFLDDNFTPPETPLGRYGPTLAIYLQCSNRSQFAQSCPYRSRCTYGTKCRYYHPETSTMPHFIGTRDSGNNTFHSIQQYNNKQQAKEHINMNNTVWPNSIKENVTCSASSHNRANKPPPLNLNAQAYYPASFQPIDASTPLNYDDESVFIFPESSSDNDQNNNETQFEKNVSSCSNSSTSKIHSSPKDLAIDCIENLWKSDYSGFDPMLNQLSKEKIRYKLFYRLCSFYPYKLVKQAMDDLPFVTEMHILDSRVNFLINNSK